jgi:enoyl-CoA hydratase
MTRLIGKAKAMELILTGDIINAQTALSIGLVNDVYSSAELMSKTLEFVNKIISKSPIAISAVIDCIQTAPQLSLPEGLSYESTRFGEVCGSEDFKEGTLAFLEKRPANFIGK